MEREGSSIEVVGGVERVRLGCGHLWRKRRKLSCETCSTLHWRQTPKGKAYRRLDKSRSYFQRYLHTGNSYLAKNLMVLNDEAENQRRYENRLISKRNSNRKYRVRWGHIGQNLIHRHRWEMIREGLWKEEEHPL